MDLQEWQEEREDLRRAFVGQLIDRVSQDTYPSSTMLDLIEQSMGPDQVADYADVLMTKIGQDRYPSLALIVRLRELL